MDRGRDVADILTATYTGWGVGAKARLGPVNVGAFADVDYGGLRGGELARVYGGEWSACDITATVMSFERFDPSNLRMARRRGKHYFSAGYAGLTLASHDRSIFDGQVLSKALLHRDLIPYYTQIEAAAGLVCGVRLGINPGEILDFVLGLTAIDIFNDDLERRERLPNRARKRTAR